MLELKPRHECMCQINTHKGDFAQPKAVLFLVCVREETIMINMKKY